MTRQIHLLGAVGAVNLTPANALLGLARQAASYRDQAARAMNSGYHSHSASLVGSIITQAFIPRGYKGLARGAGRTVRTSSRTNVKAQWLQAGRNFLSQCEVELRDISVRAKTLPPQGNSSKLVLKMNRVRRITNAVTFFGTLAVVLEEMSHLDLIWNRDIPAELQQRREATEKARREKAELRAAAPHLSRLSATVDLYNRMGISTALEGFPNVRQSVLGALDRLPAGGPDAERHCLVSCRSALEAYCVQAGGNGDWKEGLKAILSSETDQRAVFAVVNYVGGKLHGGHIPSRDEAEHGLRLTITTLTFLVGKKR